MPVQFDTQGDIDCVYALSAGKLVEATLPAKDFRREGIRYAGPATVVKLTALGCQLAEHFDGRTASRPHVGGNR